VEAPPLISFAGQNHLLKRWMVRQLPVHFRASDYDHHPDWERLGNKGWNWETFQKNLRKLEGFVSID